MVKIMNRLEKTIDLRDLMIDVSLYQKKVITEAEYKQITGFEYPSKGA